MIYISGVHPQDIATTAEVIFNDVPYLRDMADCRNHGIVSRVRKDKRTHTSP